MIMTLYSAESKKVGCAVCRRPEHALFRFESLQWQKCVRWDTSSVSSPAVSKSVFPETLLRKKMMRPRISNDGILLVKKRGYMQAKAPFHLSLLSTHTAMSATELVFWQYAEKHQAFF